jgi:hypothetical protein
MTNKKIYQLQSRRKEVPLIDFLKIIYPINSLVLDIYSIFQIDLMDLEIPKLTSYEMAKGNPGDTVDDYAKTKLNTKCLTEYSEMNLIHLTLNPKVANIEDTDLNLKIAYIRAVSLVPFLFAFFSKSDRFIDLFGAYVNDRGVVVHREDFENAFFKIYDDCTNAIKRSILNKSKGLDIRITRQEESSLEIMNLFTQDMINDKDLQRYIDPTKNRNPATTIRFSKRELDYDIEKAMSEYIHPADKLKNMIQSLRDADLNKEANQLEETVKKMYPNGNRTQYSEANYSVIPKGIRRNPDRDINISNSQKEQLKEIVNRLTNTFFEQMSIFDTYYQKAIIALISGEPMYPNALMRVVTNATKKRNEKGEVVELDGLFSFVDGHLKHQDYWVRGGIRAGIFDSKVDKDGDEVIDISDEIKLAMYKNAVRLEYIKSSSEEFNPIIPYSVLADQYRLRETTKRLKGFGNAVRRQRPGDIIPSKSLEQELEWYETQLKMNQKVLNDTNIKIAELEAEKDSCEDIIEFEKSVFIEETQKKELFKLKRAKEKQEKKRKEVTDKQESAIKELLPPVEHVPIPVSTPLITLSMARLETINNVLKSEKSYIPDIESKIKMNEEMIQAIQNAMHGTRTGGDSPLQRVIEKHIGILEEKEEKESTKDAVKTPQKTSKKAGGSTLSDILKSTVERESTRTAKTEGTESTDDQLTRAIREIILPARIQSIIYKIGRLRSLNLAAISVKLDSSPGDTLILLESLMFMRYIEESTEPGKQISTYALTREGLQLFNSIENVQNNTAINVLNTKLQQIRREIVGTDATDITPAMIYLKTIARQVLGIK